MAQRCSRRNGWVDWWINGVMDKWINGLCHRFHRAPDRSKNGELWSCVSGCIGNVGVMRCKAELRHCWSRLRECGSAFSTDPLAEAAHVEIDYRCGVKGDELRQQ